YNPNGAVFNSGNTIVWAHSVSYDLVNWIHLSHALYPTKQFDINSCWSGSATILPGNKPVIVYTGVDAKRQQTFFDHSTSRRILCGLINESDSSADDIKKGWSGIHAVPRRVFLGKTGKQLVQWPVEEIERLREKHVGYHDKKLKGHSSFEIEGIATSQVDHSVIESFGGEGRACITARVYPGFSIDKEAHLHAFNNGSLDVVISRLDAWSMKKAKLTKMKSSGGVQ
ncbi:hypothetical protein RJ639_017326, partial [Escallonia herrerae]